MHGSRPIIVVFTIKINIKLTYKLVKIHISPIQYVYILQVGLGPICVLYISYYI